MRCGTSPEYRLLKPGLSLEGSILTILSDKEDQRVTAMPGERNEVLAFTLVVVI